MTAPRLHTSTPDRDGNGQRRRLPRGEEWAAHLESLAKQLNDGRLYDRDLRAVAAAAADLNAALRRRLARHERRRG